MLSMHQAIQYGPHCLNTEDKHKFNWFARLEPLFFSPTINILMKKILTIWRKKKKKDINFL